ncbi:H-NS histone [Burkholderia diffusa]|uniref:H-NS histone n=1 Tax=Burkholderia diffusa TaxID=488732 RepID=A0AAW3P9M8_9BURK|nr:MULTISPECIES: H-NS histone family protein [Burkholderia cepacia complex]KVL46535.1 H-NS histone [Burkholderia cepacia]KVU58794.1 H-NS histone [Burkholderia cepacia]KWF32734.1 H-NS histone [Burkholderia diffusa]KWF38660.1 H-NS histone [Burkholderia diffusa]KWF46705.1 H-NS histone [Burkholderia diffusa]
MATYQELKAKAEALLVQAEEARQAELETVLEEVRARIQEYGLTPEQLFGRKRARGANGSQPATAKYQDPKTGKTWSGRGREPSWIKGKKRDRFLIAE